MFKEHDTRAASRNKIGFYNNTHRPIYVFFFPRRKPHNDCLVYFVDKSNTRRKIGNWKK